MMFEPHMMHPDPLTDRELATLPPDAQALAGQLAADGAAWRAALPSTAALDTRVRTLAHVGEEPADHQNDALVLEGPPPTVPLSTHGRASGRGRHRLGRVAGVAAMVAVVTLFAGVYALRMPGGLRGHRDAEPTPSVTRDLTWQEQPRLGPGTQGGAPEPYPIIAPGDPRVVYQADNLVVDASRPIRQAVLRRTDDGGVTWHTLPTPTQGEFASLFVSPRDSRMIILRLYQRFVDACPPFTPPPGSQDWCQPQYRSADGGMTWTPLVTPDYHVAGQSLFGLTHGIGGPYAAPTVLHEQGTRLYSAIWCPPSMYCVRIVASDDNGATWRIVDDTLVAQGEVVVNYAVAPIGATVFAITRPNPGVRNAPIPLSLWRSDDEGATWRRIGPLPTPFNGPLFAVASADPAQPLLYLVAPRLIGYGTMGKTGRGDPIFSSEADDLKVSADGGVAWQSAPTFGASTHLLAIPGLMGTLADGSALVGFTPERPGGPITLYAWRLGDATWRQITPALDAKLDTLVIAHAGGHEALWAMTETEIPVPGQTPDATGSVLHYIQYHLWRLQLS